jgi:hypothetical protein
MTLNRAKKGKRTIIRLNRAIFSASYNKCWTFELPQIPSSACLVGE